MSDDRSKIVKSKKLKVSCHRHFMQEWQSSDGDKKCKVVLSSIFLGKYQKPATPNGVKLLNSLCNPGIGALMFFPTPKWVELSLYYPNQNHMFDVLLTSMVPSWRRGLV